MLNPIDNELQTERKAIIKYGIYPLKWAAAETMLEVVTLKKYCLAGRYGFKFGGIWFLTVEEVKTIKCLPKEAHKAGRPRKNSRMKHEQ